MHARYILTVYNQTKYMQDIDIISAHTTDKKNACNI